MTDEWQRERPDTRVDSFYGPSIMRWLREEAEKDPSGLWKPGTVVRMIVQKAFARANKAKREPA